MKSFFYSTIALPVLSAAAWAQQDGLPNYGYGYEGHMWGGGGWFFLGPLMMILFLAGIVALVVLAVRWAGGEGMGRSQASGRAPLDILRERFARGAIDRDEFEERRRALGE